MQRAAGADLAAEGLAPHLADRSPRGVEVPGTASRSLLPWPVPCTPGGGPSIPNLVDSTSRRPRLSRPRRLAGPGQDLLAIAALVTVVVVAVHVAVQLSAPTPLAVPDPLRYLLDVGGEKNLPSFWNTALLVVLACSMVGLAALLPRRGGPSSDRRGWIVAGLVVAAMAADEAAGLHERVFLAAGSVLAANGVTTPSFRWVLPGAIFAGACLLLASRWLVGLPRVMRRGLLTALVVFGAGALGMEAVSGVVANGRGIGRLYHMVTAVEESLEMAAVLLALRHVWDAFSTARGPDGRVVVTTTWPIVVDHRDHADGDRSHGSAADPASLPATRARSKVDGTP